MEINQIGEAVEWTPCSCPMFNLIQSIKFIKWNTTKWQNRGRFNETMLIIGTHIELNKRECYSNGDSNTHLSHWSQRQMVPSSQTLIRMRPSREKVVCRIGDVHFICDRGMARIWVGSGVSMSHTKSLPLWLPNAMNWQFGSNANRMNQISQSLNSKRCRIEADESLYLAPLPPLSLKRPGFQHTMEFSHDWKKYTNNPDYLPVLPSGVTKKLLVPWT